jgi:hypothetical protein
MSLRIMLPSRAKVGDTIHFAFPNVPGRAVSAFEVTINGKKFKDPAVLTTRTPNGGTANFVFKVEETGIYHFEIAPIDAAGQRAEPRLNTLEVAAQSIVTLE